MNVLAAISVFVALSLYYGETEAVCTYHREPCINGNQYYFFGERWQNEKCETCKCKSVGYKCCTKYWYPVDVPEDCVARWEEKLCGYKIVQRKDETKECVNEPRFGVL